MKKCALPLCELLNNVNFLSFLIMFFSYCLKMLCLYLNTLTIGQKCCYVLCLLNDILLQKELQKML